MTPPKPRRPKCDPTAIDPMPVAIYGLRVHCTVLMTLYLAIKIAACLVICVCLTMQIFYLTIIGVTYTIVAKSSFKYIPGYYVSEYHRYFQRKEIQVSNYAFFFRLVFCIHKLENVSYYGFLLKLWAHN